MARWATTRAGKVCSAVVGLVCTLALAAASGREPQAAGRGQPAPLDPRIGKSFRVPYKLTETNHFLVRVRLNGKGPFHFLVDSGAPMLIVGTEAAAKIGLKPVRDQFWTKLERLDFEGGARLTDLKARVEDPFQLVGMNALGLPGTSIDGILGFTILARFRLEIDPSQDRMTWTRLDYHPPEPPIPDLAKGEGPPPAVQAMNAIGPLAKGLAFLMGKQPSEDVRPRGFLGVSWSEDEGKTHRLLIVKAVLEGSPAHVGGIKPGDVVARIGGQAIASLKDAREALAAVYPGDSVALAVERGPEHTLKKLTVIAGKGF